MTIDEAKFQNEFVYQCYQKNLISVEDCICSLVETINEQRMEIIKLTRIAPFKVIDEDGKEFIWRYPEESAPESKAFNFNKEKK